MQLRHSAPDMLELVPGDGIDEATANRSPLVGYNLSGGRTPLFCLRAWREEVDKYRSLAAALGPDQPIVTVSPPRVEDGVPVPQDTEQWGRFFFRQLGPLVEREDLVLGGWSYAGIVSLWMAEELARRGRPPRLVNLIDSIMPVAKPRGDARKRGRFHRFVLKLAKGLEIQDDTRRRQYFETYARQQSAKFLRRRGEDLENLRVRLRGGTPAERPPRRYKRHETPPPAEPLKWAVRVGYLKHRPRPTRLPVALYWTEASERQLGDVTLGWCTVLHGRLHVHPLAGNHTTLFCKENVGVLAAALAAELRIATEGSRPASLPHHHRPSPPRRRSA